MRRIAEAVGVAILLGSSQLLLAGPAAAAPEVSKMSCAQQGGTFSQTNGTKSCTTSTTQTTAGPTLYTVASDATCAQGDSATDVFCYFYQGTYHVVTTVGVTTTRSQKGNGAVTTTDTTTPVSSTVVPDGCTRNEQHTDPFRYDIIPVPISECADRGLYPSE